MKQPDEPIAASVEVDRPDLTLQREMERLYDFTVYVRWLAIAVLWLSVGSLSLWGLRYPFSLIREYFTWAAVRYGLAFHAMPAIGLGLCIGCTMAVLIRLIRNRLLGLPRREKQRLERQVYRIRQKGTSHPLWHVIRPG
jgi:hypothetical protein